MIVNDKGDIFDNDEPVNEQSFGTPDYSTGTFTQPTEDGGFVIIAPEYIPYSGGGIVPSGRFHINYTHTEHGTNMFYIEQDIYLFWKGKNLPPFITEEFVEWLGDLIERRDK